MSLSKLAKGSLSSLSKRVSASSGVILSSGTIATASSSSLIKTFTTSSSNHSESNQDSSPGDKQRFNRNNRNNNYQNQNQNRNRNDNQNQNRNRNRNNNRNNHRASERLKPSLPREHIRNAFDQDLLELRERLTLSNQRTAVGSTGLTDTRVAMSLYSQLKETPGVLAKSDVAALIQGLQASARISVRSMARVISTKRKEALVHQHDVLSNYLEIIGNDLLSGRVTTNDFGLMVFFTTYSTLGRPNRGLELYERFSTATEQNPDFAKLVNSSAKVKGSLFVLMISAGIPLEKIEQVYQETKEQGISALNIEHNMIRAYVLNERITEALKLYSNVVKLYLEDPDSTYYFGRIHDFFVGDCSDLDVALNFYFEAVEGKVPYYVECHPSAVHRLMELSWREHKDFNEILKIWGSYLGSVRSYRESSYNMLTYGMLLHFFETYPKVSPEAYDKLKDIISTYNEKKSMMSVLFLNSLLAIAGGKWQDKEVILGIIDSYGVYNLPKKVDSLRVILNSLRGVDVEVDVVRNFWEQRLNLVGEETIERYDLWALAKACNRSEERVSFFVETWNKFLEEYQPPKSIIDEIVSFWGVPSNESGNIYDAVTGKNPGKESAGSTIESAVKSESVVEPVTESTSEPVSETTEPATESATEPTTEVATEPTEPSESTTESTAESTESTAESTTESTTESTAESTAESTESSESTAESANEPATEHSETPTESEPKPTSSEIPEQK